MIGLVMLLKRELFIETKLGQLSQRFVTGLQDFNMFNSVFSIVSEIITNERDARIIWAWADSSKASPTLCNIIGFGGFILFHGPSRSSRS